MRAAIASILRCKLSIFMSVTLRQFKSFSANAKFVRQIKMQFSRYFVRSSDMLRYMIVCDFNEKKN